VSRYATQAGNGGLQMTIHSIFSSPWTATVAIIVIIAYIVDRQLKPRPLDNKELLLTPLLLLYFGANTMSQISITPIAMIDIIASVGIGVYFGVLSLRGITLYADTVHGEAIVKGTWKYLQWYALSILARMIITGGLYVVGGNISLKITEVGFLLSAAAFVGTRSLYLYYRSQQLGIPLAQKRR